MGDNSSLKHKVLYLNAKENAPTKNRKHVLVQFVSINFSQNPLVIWLLVRFEFTNSQIPITFGGLSIWRYEIYSSREIEEGKDG
ncbi:MAG TPA: hypothetical protein DEA78_09595 [Cyanobacteria bacterium UBA11159]|nr:hypothetical protein [Cyanobacteria bacterium UBA11367]HBE58638.1 hypothetical protein [Cyanobacteria bacterium UBA11366]HBK66689.1 hypothetical protein [Cyanobacteria bacterium UBA11166]HBR73946.1 hypothetical protein [Cyanobacteria bacterium UBA11159]HBS69622.1 hypothetical protein [Cyanobacteria bacterium UBA11153]